MCERYLRNANERITSLVKINVYIYVIAIFVIRQVHESRVNKRKTRGKEKFK